MSEMFGSEKRPFYNSARGIDMDAIPLDVYMDFVQRLFRENGKDIETEAIAYVYDQFKGVTLYNQQIMNDAFAATPQNEKCDRPTVEVMVDNFVQENDKRIREILRLSLTIRKPCCMLSARMSLSKPSHQELSLRSIISSRQALHRML